MRPSVTLGSPHVPCFRYFLTGEASLGIRGNTRRRSQARLAQRDIAAMATDEIYRRTSRNRLERQDVIIGEGRSAERWNGHADIDEANDFAG